MLAGITHSQLTIEKAIQAVSGQETFLVHVKKVRIGVDYVILMRQVDFKKEADDRNIKFNMRLNERLDRFKTDIKAVGLGSQAGIKKEYKSLFKEIEQIKDLKKTSED